MDNDYIKSRLAPCGLHCGKCFAFIDGDIKNYSNKLKDLLGDFGIYAERFTVLLNEPVFGKYREFYEFLDYLSTLNCNGCRKEKCKLFKDCKVRDCYEQKGVDFCYQCHEFPCNNTGFDQHLNKRSVEINKEIKKISIEKYYEKVKDIPRY